jgi:hypothetical protein
MSVVNTTKLLLPLTLLLSCCSPSRDETRQTRPIQDYEAGFDPSKYRTKDEENPDVKSTEPEPSTSADAPVYIDRVEKAMGFRVQVFSTTDIDAALRKKDEYRLQLDPQAVEMVFDAPYYKIRVGNFLEKKEAEECHAMLVSKGITAWIVRDLVTRTVKEQIRKK